MHVTKWADSLNMFGHTVFLKLLYFSPLKSTLDSSPVAAAQWSPSLPYFPRRGHHWAPLDPLKSGPSVSRPPAAGQRENWLSPTSNMMTLQECGKWSRYWFYFPFHSLSSPARCQHILWLICTILYMMISYHCDSRCRKQEFITLWPKCFYQVMCHLKWTRNTRVLTCPVDRHDIAAAGVQTCRRPSLSRAPSATCWRFPSAHSSCYISRLRRTRELDGPVCFVFHWGSSTTVQRDKTQCAWESKKRKKPMSKVFNWIIVMSFKAWGQTCFIISLIHQIYLNGSLLPSRICCYSDKSHFKVLVEHKGMKTSRSQQKHWWLLPWNMSWLSPSQGIVSWSG